MLEPRGRSSWTDQHDAPYLRQDNSLFLRLFNLECDNITILDLILQERLLHLHTLNHTRFDFLWSSALPHPVRERTSTHLKQFDRNRVVPLHLLLDQRNQLLDLLRLLNEYFALADKPLLVDIEPFKEDHDGWVVGVGMQLVGLADPCRQNTHSSDCAYGVESGMIRIVIEVQP